MDPMGNEYTIHGSYGVFMDLRSRCLDRPIPKKAVDPLMEYAVLLVHPRINMEPEKKSLEKEVPLGNHHFQVPC